MTKGIYRTIFLSLGCSLFLQACATHPFTTDALPTLKPGEGIAGISFDAIEPLKQVRFADVAGNQKLLIDHVPFGESAFLFVVPAGRYCVERYSTSEYGATIETPPDDRCFDVEAGKLSYSGTFTPDFNPGEVAGTAPYLPGMIRKDNPRAFLNALSLNYPHIAAAAFPTDSDRSVAELAPPGPPPSGGICTLLKQEEAAQLLAMPVAAGTEFNTGVLDACNFLHSDDESVHVMIGSAQGIGAAFQGVGYDASATGATSWIPILSLGDKASFGCKKSNCEIDVLWHARMLMVVVDGTDRQDIQEALTALTRVVFSRWLAAPDTGIAPAPHAQVVAIPPRK